MFGSGQLPCHASNMAGKFTGNSMEFENREDGAAAAPELSIIIPVYNMEKYLRRCLDSVVAALETFDELYKRTEVLIINDGSKDSSPQIISEYCEKHPYMVQFDKANGGLSDVKNYGLKRAQGEFVIFLDSDDYVMPEMYYMMLRTARRDEADVVVCDLEMTFDDPSKNDPRSCSAKYRLKEDIFAQVICMDMMPASWNKLVKRSLYRGLSFPVGRNNEDISVTPIVLARAQKISVVHVPFYKYYQRSDSIQNSRFNEKRFVILETSKILANRLEKELRYNKEHGIEGGLDERKAELIKGSVYVHQILAVAMYPIRREKFKDRRRMLRKYVGRIEHLFPDFWQNPEIDMLLHRDPFLVRLSRKISLDLMKSHSYFLLSVYWDVCNRIYDFQVDLVEKYGEK